MFRLTSIKEIYNKDQIPKMERGIDVDNFFHFYEVSQQQKIDERIKTKDTISRTSLLLWWNKVKQWRKDQLQSKSLDY